MNQEAWRKWQKADPRAANSYKAWKGRIEREQQDAVRQSIMLVLLFIITIATLIALWN